MRLPFQTPQDRPPVDRGADVRSLPPAAAAAVLMAFLASSQIQLSMVGHGHDWWRLFAWQLGGLGYWVAAAPWILRSGGRFQSSRMPVRMAREAVKALAWTAVQVPFVTAVFLLLQPYEPVATYSVGDAFEQSFRTWVHVDFIIYFTGLAIGYGVAGHRRARSSELRHSQLDAELARAQLEALRLQIQPHFLFNTLHSIAALMRRRRNERALEMLLGLSELLRATLEHPERQRIPLSEELRFARLYVDIQRARFADRLTVAYEIDEACLEAPVPALILQPLLENAIRHGIAPRAAPGNIVIAAGARDGRLRLAVDDDGVGLPEGSEIRDGIGLGNTRSRVARLYGGEASVDLCRRPGGGASAVVVLPAEGLLPVPREAVA